MRRQDGSILRTPIAQCDMLDKKPNTMGSQGIKHYLGEHKPPSLVWQQHHDSKTRRGSCFFLVTLILMGFLRLFSLVLAIEIPEEGFLPWMQEADSIFSLQTMEIQDMFPFFLPGYGWDMHRLPEGAPIHSLDQEDISSWLSGGLPYAEVWSRKRQPLPSLHSKKSYLWLQRQYEKLYGISHEQHNQRYAEERRSLQILYRKVLYTNRDLQRAVVAVEKILAPLTLPDVLLALAKAESNYDNLAIGAHGEASVFQLTPRFAYHRGLKVYQWEKYLADCKRYGEMQASRLHTQALQRLVIRYQQRYSPAKLFQELAKEDDRFNLLKIIHLMITHLTDRIKWLHEEGMSEILPLVFIGYNGGVGRLKKVLKHLQSKKGSLGSWEESYRILSQRIRLYTHKLLVDLALTRYQNLNVTMDYYF